MSNSDSKSNEKFKLPNSSLDGVLRVLQGYAERDGDTSLDEISKITGMHITEASKKTGFLVELGLLQGKKNKSITERGKNLASALEHGIEERVQSILVDIVKENEFLRDVLASVRIRKGMDDSALRAHVAYSAGQPKNDRTKAGSGAVIEFLKRSGYLVSEDGNLVVTSSPLPANAEKQEHDRQTTESDSVTEKAMTYRQGSMNRSGVASPFSVSIQIEVQCKPGDLDNLGGRLRKVIEDFNNRHSDGEEDTQEGAN